MSAKKTYKLKHTKNTKPCEVTLEIVLPKETVLEHRTKALTSLGEQIKLDGFRPGHIPEKILVEKVGELSITEEAARLAIDDIYSEIILESKQMPINQPQITITKLATDTDIELEISFAIPPVIDIADYKKISKKHNSKKDETSDITATEEEIEAMMLDLRKQVAHMNYHATHNHSDHSHGDLEPAALDEDFAKKVGPNFKTVDDVRAAVKENIEGGKKQKATEKSRIELIDAIIADSKIEYPEFFLTSEQGILIEELRADLARMGSTLEDYLKQINKSETELREERKEVADKRVRSQLALSKIAVSEDIKPDTQVVEEQVKDIMKQHPSAAKENVVAFVERFELNQLVWKFLEEIK